MKRAQFAIFNFLLCACALTFFTLPLRAQNETSWISSLQSVPVQRAALALSRRAATQFLADKTIITPPQNLPTALNRRAAVFVTIEKRGQIAPRGCRGTLQPITSTLAQEIIRNTVAACTRDAQQPPLRKNELPNCLFSLTVVTRVQPISNLSQHDATRNGLIAQNGSRIGVVLPFEGRDARTQLSWARRKAGLRDHERAQLFELFAVRFREMSQ